MMTPNKVRTSFRNSIAKALKFFRLAKTLSISNETYHNQEILKGRGLQVYHTQESFSIFAWVVLGFNRDRVMLGTRVYMFGEGEAWWKLQVLGRIKRGFPQPSVLWGRIVVVCCYSRQQQNKRSGAMCCCLPIVSTVACMFARTNCLAFHHSNKKRKKMRKREKRLCGGSLDA